MSSEGFGAGQHSDISLSGTSIKWPVRLSARTPGFHPGKRGSIPLRATRAE